MPSSPGSSAQLRDRVERHEETARALGEHDVGRCAKLGVRRHDAGRVDRDARLGRRDVRRDRRLEEAGIHERVGMARARFGLQQQRVLVRRALGPGDRARRNRLHAGHANAGFPQAPQQRRRRQRLADAGVGAGDKEASPRVDAHRSSLALAKSQLTRFVRNAAT